MAKLPKEPFFKPSEHICELCGEPLSAHRSTGAHCSGGEGTFYPDAETRALFAPQYK